MKKTILITGSTDGIGKLAALKLAKDGNHVYLHGRNADKMEKVIAEIKTQSKNDFVEGFVADFSNLEAAKEMAKKVNAKLPKIDALVNNAGVLKSSKVQNEGDLDIRFVVNYFAPYILTNALLPLLQKADAPRIVNLSSAAQIPISYEAMAGKIKQSDIYNYAQSKLALTMWSFDLAQKWSEIAVFALNPGSKLNTNMVREAFGSYWSPADKGANIIYCLAVSTEYEGVTGKYFDNDKGELKGAFGKAHEDAYDRVAIEKLLAETDSILSKL